MFHNFIYFIVVLLIYTTYQPSKDTGFTPPESMLLAFCLLIAFAVVTWVQFRRLEHRISEAPLPQLDHRFNSIVTRQAVLAILVFAINIYGLNLTSLFSDIFTGGYIKSKSPNGHTSLQISCLRFPCCCPGFFFQL